MPEAGDQFGEFVLRQELGRGAMGMVWEAWQPSLARAVALKILNEGVGSDPIWVARFKAEAAQAARLSHPGILPVYAVGETQGLHWFAMEKVEGEDLARRLEARGPLPFDEAARFACDAARALAHAHERGVIHRDIKPANLMLRSDGRVALTDFGLSKELGSGALTTTGLLVGTPYYMSPELVGGKPDAVGPATDTYGLGVTLYELLVGEPPFRAETAAALIRMIADTEPEPPSRRRAGLPRDLETITLTCLAKRPERRYAGCAALADDLERFLAHEPISMRRAGVFERTGRFLARHRLAVSMAAVALLLLAGLTVFFLGRLDDQARDYRERIDSLLEEATLHAEAGDLEQAQAAEEQVQALAQESPEAALHADLAQARALVAALRMGRPLTPEQRRRLSDWAGAEPTHLTLTADATGVELSGILLSDPAARALTPRTLDGRELPAGLWRFHARAPGRALTIFTVLAHPGSSAVLELKLPSEEQVPASMVAYGGGWFPPEQGAATPGLEQLLPAYLLDRERVTVAAYAAFLRGAPAAQREELTPDGWKPGRPPRGQQDGDPMLGLTRPQAEAYARSQGKRLPTDQELMHATGPAPLSEVLRTALGASREEAARLSATPLQARLKAAFEEAGERLARLEGLQDWNGLPEWAVGGAGPHVGQATPWPRFTADGATPPAETDAPGPAPARGRASGLARRARETLERLASRTALRLAR